MMMDSFCLVGRSGWKVLHYGMRSPGWQRRPRAGASRFSFPESGRTSGAYGRKSAARLPQGRDGRHSSTLAFIGRRGRSSLRPTTTNKPLTRSSDKSPDFKLCAIYCRISSMSIVHNVTNSLISRVCRGQPVDSHGNTTCNRDNTTCNRDNTAFNRGNTGCNRGNTACNRGNTACNRGNTACNRGNTACNRDNTACDCDSQVFCRDRQMDRRFRRVWPKRRASR